MFHGVQSVAAATYMRIELGARHATVAEPTEHRYWDLNFPTEVDGYDSRPLPVLCDEYGRLLGKSVDLRLQADVPVGSYLSGGVDSALILQTAAELRGKTVPAFTVSVSAKRFDETAHAAEMAQCAAGVWHQTHSGDDALRDDFPLLTSAAEAPVIDTACTAMLLQAREVRWQGYKVVLSGEGADEWFAGYPWFKVGKLVGLLDRGNLHPSNALRRLGVALGGRPGAWKRVTEIQDRVGGPNSVADLYAFLCFPSRQAFYSQEMWERIGDSTPFDDLPLNLENVRGCHPLNRALYLGAKTILPGLLLSQKGDRPGMANSVELRYPFLDEDLVSFCAALPPQFKLRGMTRDKVFLRQYARRLLPPRVAARRKRMFRAPMARALLRDSPAFVDQLLSAESLRRTGYFDGGAVEQARQRLPTARLPTLKRVSAELGLMGVIATQLWHHLFLGGGLSELPAWTPEAARIRSAG